MLMATFMLLTRLSPQSLHQPKSFSTLEHHVTEQLRAHCPDVAWRASYALLGPWDYLYVIEAPSVETATRVSVLVRSYGHAHTEVWPAMPWPAFKEVLRQLPARD
jgi:uncharacterized protein with GYD domain